ncbi:MAG: hypothetical protein FWH57_11770 [Oscillospiraceae bacterium]|nr:hypothetical protein [Oscillospiraceae bacterium]
MRIGLLFKTLFRSPMRMIIVIVILGIVTFALITQMVEFIITTREFNNAVMYFAGVGAVETDMPQISTDPAAPFDLLLDSTYTGLRSLLTENDIEAISTLPYISSIDTRFMGAGVSSKYFRMDDGEEFFNFTARAVIEATVYGEPYIRGNVAIFPICDAKILAGRPPGDIERNNVMLSGYMQNPGSGAFGIDSKRMYYIRRDEQKYGFDMMSDLSVGSRYVFVIRFEPKNANSLFIGDYLSDSWCDAIIPITNISDDYPEANASAPSNHLNELVEITNADIHTFDMVYADDMGSIMRFADRSMVVFEGRMITRADSSNASKVCVVSADFSNANNVGIGDFIDIELGSMMFEQYINLGAIASTPERYAKPVKTEALEIIGVYTNVDSSRNRASEPHWSYSVNTIFLPKSLMPTNNKEITNHEFAPGEFSIKVGNAWDISAFVEETAPLIESMGYTLRFNDAGWGKIESVYEKVKNISYVKIAASLAATIAAIALAIFLFISNKKKDLAVMLALGTTKQKAVLTLAFPLMVLSIIAALGGSIAATVSLRWIIARNEIIIAVSEYVTSDAVHMAAPIVCALSIIVLSVVSTIVYLCYYSRKPPLEILHSRPNI